MSVRSSRSTTVRVRAGVFALAARTARTARSARTARTALAALLALSSVSACAGFLRSEFGTPVVELKDVRVKGIG
ncbi:MAG: hypothetical protein ACHQQR_13095, partial [Gemmatimonadales bacterium]